MIATQRIASSTSLLTSTSRAALCALALAAGMGHASASELVKGGTTAISLDNNCDVLTVTVYTWNQAAFNDNCFGSVIGLGAGMEGKVIGVPGKDLTIGENIFGIGAIYIWNIEFPLQTGKGWQIFKSTDGANFTPINSGTYTVVGADDAFLPHAGPPAYSGSRSAD